jgi:hypothetical protein
MARKHGGVFPDSVVNDALNLFLQGYSAEKISKELKTSGHDVSASIIRKWAVRYKWKDRRSEVQQKRIEHVIESTLDDITQIKNQTSLLIKAMFNAILDKDGNALVGAKSIEGAATAIDRMHQTLLSIEKNEKDKFNPIEFLRLIHESMAEIPELKEALEKPGVRDRFFKVIKNKSEQRMTKEIVIR